MMFDDMRVLVQQHAPPWPAARGSRGPNRCPCCSSRTPSAARPTTGPRLCAHRHSRQTTGIMLSTLARHDSPESSGSCSGGVYCCSSEQGLGVVPRSRKRAESSSRSMRPLRSSSYLDHTHSSKACAHRGELRERQSRSHMVSSVGRGGRKQAERSRRPTDRPGGPPDVLDDTDALASWHTGLGGSLHSSSLLEEGLDERRGLVLDLVVGQVGVVDEERHQHAQQRDVAFRTSKRQPTPHGKEGGRRRSKASSTLGLGRSRPTSYNRSLTAGDALHSDVLDVAGLRLAGLSGAVLVAAAAAAAQTHTHVFGSLWHSPWCDAAVWHRNCWLWCRCSECAAPWERVGMTDLRQPADRPQP